MQFVSEIKRFYRSCNKLAFCYGIFMAVQVLGFVPSFPQPLVYLVSILFAFHCFQKSKSNEQILGLFLLYVPVEILLANPHSFFQPWPRYILFALLLINVSSLTQSEHNRKLRDQLFQIFMYVAVIVGVGSFFCYYLGINYMHNFYGMTFDQKVGLFGGLTTHSMLLGPLAGFGTLFMVYNAYLTKDRTFWVLAAFCIGSCFFSASRTSVVGCVAASMITIYKLSGEGSKFMKTAIIIMIVLAVTAPMWEGFVDIISQKNASNAGSGTFGSRDAMWTARFKEFLSSPLWGVGFVSLAPENANMWAGGSGQIEPGTSWLAIPSMLGLLGVFILIPFFYKTYMTVWKMKDERSCLCLGVLTFFFIHMMSEGYIFSAGGYLCFALWLTCGCCMDRKYLGSR